MSYTYLASPYTHDDPEVMEQRFRAVCRAAARLMRKGELVFSPIAHTHPIAVAGELPRGWEFWERYDRVMISHASRFSVLMLPGWKQSKGVTAEVKIARELGRLIGYIKPEGV